ncbi:MAG TPA: hypothetical protein VFU31_16500 [Candidatus Binatia bacterium]|nr:hypothetical protein [Candidatus Binatia bacterium]
MIEAIADGTLVIPLLEVDGNSQIVFFKLNCSRIVDNWTVTVATKLVWLSAKLSSLDRDLRHGAYGGERYRLAFLTAVGAEQGIFLIIFH